MPPVNKRTTNNRKQQTIVVGPNEAGKLPPQAIELEESVLGAIMLEKDAYGSITDIIKSPECFYKVAHVKIFEAMQQLAQHDNIDMLSVIEQLKKNGTLEEVGGPLYISQLTSKVASTAHLVYHAQIIAQKALARDLIRMAATIESKAYDETQDVEDLMMEAETEIFDISQKSQKREIVQIRPVIDEAFARIKKASENENKMSGVPTGFTELDKITSGWQNSDLIIIAARPAMGKTAFVLSMAKNMAVDYGRPVAIFSLEMSNVQLVNRLMMNVCEIDGAKIRSGVLSSEEWRQLEDRISILIDAPIYVDDTPSLSVFELRSKAMKLKQEKNISCIIIDYLQLMNASGMNFGSREQEVSIISRNLKALAKELDIPVIALSQLNRSVTGRSGVDGKRPQLSDLRESGAIEQDADMVCFIHRPEYYFKNSTETWDTSMEGKAEIIVAKHRNGATDTIKLCFEQRYARFLNEGENTNPFDHSDISPRLDNGQQYQTLQSKINNDIPDDPLMG